MGAKALPGTLCAPSQYATIGLPVLERNPYPKKGNSDLRRSVGMSGGTIWMDGSSCVSENNALAFWIEKKTGRGVESSGRLRSPWIMPKSSYSFPSGREQPYKGANTRRPVVNEAA